MAEPDVARFEALLTSRGRELLDRIATEAPGPDTALPPRRSGRSALGARRAAHRSDDLTARHLCADGPAHTLDRSAVRGPAPLVGAIGRVCEVHHGSDLSDCNAVRVQVGVHVLGNMVWRPTPPDIVADEVCHPDEGLLVALRPSEAEAAQLSEVRVISGTGTSTRSSRNQGSAKKHGDGQSGQPAR